MTEADMRIAIGIGMLGVALFSKRSALGVTTTRQ